MGEKLTRRAALACLGSGAIAMVVDSSAFSSIEPDRNVTVDVAGAGQDALLEIESVGNIVDKKNKATDILQISNNFDEDLSLDVSVDAGSGISEENTFANTVTGGGGRTTYSASCDGNSGGGSADVTVTVNSATGSSVTVEDASYTFSIQRDCPGNNGGGGRPNGAGFSSASVSNLPANVGGGNTVTQEFSFSLTDNLKSKDGHYVDVFADGTESDGVKYANSGTGYTVTSGSGSVYPNPGSGALFRFDVGNIVKKKDTVTIQVTVEQTPGSGTFNAYFERSDRNDQLETEFTVEGSEGSSQAFTSVSAENVPSNVSGGDDTEQLFSFTPGERIQSYNNQYVEIDVSDGDGNGVTYGKSGGVYRVIQGPGNVYRNTGGNSGPIRYQVPSQGGNQQVIIGAMLQSTASSGGPYTVEFSRTDKDYPLDREPAEDSFSIE